MNEQNIILKCLVGSRAHGLHNEDSDYDFRGVFVLPTEEILSLKNVGGKYKANSWFEGEQDQTLYEIGHFLKLATKCNPSILEVFKAPVEEEVDLGNNNIVTRYTHSPYKQITRELLELFKYCWNPNDAFNAFCGYSHNQQVKMLKHETSIERVPKYACAYLRTLYNLEQLLSTGDFTLDVAHNPEFFKRLKEIRNGDFTVGDIINEANKRVKVCEKLKDKCKQVPDLEKVNKFLLKVRKEYWK